MLELSIRRFVAGSMLLLLASVSSAAQAPDEQPQASVVRESFYVPVRDGTRLAMNVYRPAVEGAPTAEPLPAVFLFTPYRARFYDKDGKISETGLSSWLPLKHLLERGYVVAVADVRGKGASFGKRRGFQDRTEAQDGYDLVEWLARQPYSTGKVGMIGCSYLGGTTVQVASTAPPSLKAIFTGASDFDKYAFVRRGGIPAQFNTRPDEPPEFDLASVPVDADTDGSLLRAAVAEHAANTPMAKLWYGMPYRDSVSEYTGTAFWEEVGPYTYLDTLKKSGIATYFWGNWQDEPAAHMILSAANVGGKLIVTPGSHCVPPKDFDFAGEAQRFFDRYLKGLDNGIDREPLYTYWVENAPKGEEWVRTNVLPGSGVGRKAFYLAAREKGSARSANDGRLRDTPGEAGEDRFAVDYDVSSPEYFDFWVKPQGEHGLTYTGEALPADVTLLGFPIVHLDVAIDRADANVFAYLEDVAPDGSSEVVSFGRLAVSHRKISKAPYETLGLPWHSGRQADVAHVKPGESVGLAFDLTPLARIVKAGHRLRVTLTGADPRQRNLAEIRQDPPPKITILRSASGGSRIELPIARVGGDGN